MDYLVDTNVFCEKVKKAPSPKVVQWLVDHESQIYVSTVTIAEIRRGIEKLPDGKRKTEFGNWLHDFSHQMKGSILSFNRSVAHVWGQMQGRLDKQGILVPQFDGIIAATAIRYNLQLVTRNEKDFQFTAAKVINPF